MGSLAGSSGGLGRFLGAEEVAIMTTHKLIKAKNQSEKWKSKQTGFDDF